MMRLRYCCVRLNASAVRLRAAAVRLRAAQVRLRLQLKGININFEILGRPQPTLAS